MEQRQRVEHRTGQSTLEYILVVAAILVAVIIGANVLVSGGVKDIMTKSDKTISDAAGKLKGGVGL